MRDIVDNNEESYFTLLMNLEVKKHEFRVENRPLIWFRNTVIIILVSIVCASIFNDNWGNDTFVSGWCVFTYWIAGIVYVSLLIYFFNIFYHIARLGGDYSGEKFGFRGVERIKRLVLLKKEIEEIEVQLRVLQGYQTYMLSIEEQYELYKGELLQAIREYQRKANRNRWVYFIMQIIIIACSLFVGSLTSGLTSFIGIFGNHWIAPTFSYTVSFLTAMVTLFRPRERGYNLQQTADAIQYEIDCANRHIYGYKGLSNENTYNKLAEEVEKLRNEQRKRQQQLEQASEVKHSTE